MAVAGNLQQKPAGHWVSGLCTGLHTALPAANSPKVFLLGWRDCVSYGFLQKVWLLSDVTCLYLYQDLQGLVIFFVLFSGLGASVT